MLSPNHRWWHGSSAKEERDAETNVAMTGSGPPLMLDTYFTHKRLRIACCR